MEMATQETTMEMPMAITMMVRIKNQATIFLINCIWNIRYNLHSTGNGNGNINGNSNVGRENGNLNGNGES